MSKYTRIKGGDFGRVVVQDNTLEVLANQYYSGGASGQNVSLSAPASAQYALMNVDAGSEMRWRDDGGNASAGFGILMAAGDERWYFGDVSQLSVYMSSGTAGYFYFYK